MTDAAVAFEQIPVVSFAGWSAPGADRPAFAEHIGLVPVITSGSCPSGDQGHVV